MCSGTQEDEDKGRNGAGFLLKQVTIASMFLHLFYAFVFGSTGGISLCSCAMRLHSHAAIMFP